MSQIIFLHVVRRYVKTDFEISDSTSISHLLKFINIVIVIVYDMQLMNNTWVSVTIFEIMW